MNIRYAVIMLALAAVPAMGMQKKKGVKRKSETHGYTQIDAEEMLKLATQENEELTEERTALKQQIEELTNKAKKYKGKFRALEASVQEIEACAKQQTETYQAA